MSQEIYSGSFVKWTENDQPYIGQVLNLVRIVKSADTITGDARVRVFQQNQPIDQVSVVPLSSLMLMEDPTEKALANPVTAANLDKYIASLTDEEKKQAAFAWFKETGPRLPTLTVGDEPERTVMNGVSTGKAPAPAVEA